MSTARRVPQQRRAERRVTQLLQAAAAVFAETGYDNATMTAIAERAGASIGAIYQYFSNREAVVLALRNRFGNEMETRWLDVEQFTQGMSTQQIAHHFVDVMVEFADQHPAYFVVFDAPVKGKRDREDRDRLRRRLANLFRSRNPALSPETAFRIANVSLEIIKSINDLYRDLRGNLKERQALVQEYKLVLTAYLESRLSPVLQRGEVPSQRGETPSQTAQ